MRIIKRNGKEESLRLEKITKRIESATSSLSGVLDPDLVSQKVISGCYDGITTDEIDTLACETAAQLIIEHPDYSMLASRLAITALEKVTPKSFSKVVDNLYNFIDPMTGDRAGMISDEVYDIIMKNKDRLNSHIIHKRDWNIDFFGFRTLERAYLLRINNKPAERIQHMWMRVAVGIWGENIDKAIDTYDLMSEKYATHATPTLFNSGTKRPQMSSCFLIAMKEDSIEGIYDTLKQSALISQSAGGIGLHIHNVRATGSYIKGTNGYSNGIVPMLRNFDMTARYVDQCFDPKTNVKTDSGLVPISEIKEGDKVLTSDGNYNTVKNNKKFPFEERNFVRLDTKDGHNIVTDEHLFLVIKNGKGVDSIKEKVKNGQYSPEWVKSSEITTNDLLINMK